MKVSAFVKDRFLLLILHFVCMCCLTVFLLLTGTSEAAVALILIFWCLVLFSWMAVTYRRLRRFFGEAEQILEKTDQRFLLGELLPKSHRLEDTLYREMIRTSNKSVIEQIHQIEDEQKEYKEYIESWVHEVKAPITGISLMCENRRKSGAEEYGLIALENQRIENYVDMVLYYARSEDVYKDYLIHETDLQEVACEVLAKNRLYLIQNGVQAEVECNDPVYTDAKWIAFMLGQMILNSVKYAKENTKIHIYTEKTEHTVSLVLEDNGIGIPKEEIGRIFEKGFTGSNGRDRERSTGMGLYLCHKLCEKLGIQIKAESEYGKGTKMILTFPVSKYIIR